jgi:hypothetical protein
LDVAKKCEKIYEVEKAATSATMLSANNLTRYIWRYESATVRYIIVIAYEEGGLLHPQIKDTT